MFILGLLLFYGGACIGSFVHEIYGRYQPTLPFLSYVKTLSVRASHCAHCQTRLSFLQLLPLYAWITQKGKTRCCQQKLSCLYLITEIGGGLCALSGFLFFGLTPTSILWAFLFFMLIAISLIDRDHFIIPDFFHAVFILFVALFMMLNWHSISLLESIGSAFFAALLLFIPRTVYFWRHQKQGLGFGDVKLGFSLGLFLPFEWIPYFILIAATIGILQFCLLFGVSKRRANRIPFAPALLVSQFGLKTVELIAL